jgi:hypothetical protein
MYSVNTKTVFFAGIIALNLQSSPHLPHRIHFSESTIGYSTNIFSSSVTIGFRKILALGSSTSASIKVIFLFRAERLVEIVVFPVPPFPLNTAIFILNPS